MPQGRFSAPAPLSSASNGTDQIVRFVGDDDRTAEFPLCRLGFPGWTEPLGQAFADRIGLAGGVRTRTSAAGIWAGVVQFMDYLGEIPSPPAEPSQLRPEHIQGFTADIVRRYASEAAARAFVRRATSVLRRNPVVNLLAEDTRDCLHDRHHERRERTNSGYSDGELRRLVARLRQDVGQIRDRIQAGQNLLERYRRTPEQLSPTDRERAAVLAEVAQTGAVPEMRHINLVSARRAARSRIAEQLFLGPADLVPIAALFIALSDRNVETIKELPAVGQVLEGKAVEVVLVKRRRGAGRWYETVSWEIGQPGRELYHPGGLFLLVQQLTALSRTFSGAERLWALWRNGQHHLVRGAAEHYDPFAQSLRWPSETRYWSARQDDLRSDPIEGQEPARLTLDCLRLKQSVEVRRTKQLGGHLPSAARSNTYPVLFSNYLSGDATAREWAQEVMADAVIDAERAAWQAHKAALERAGGRLRLVTGEPTPERIVNAGVEPETARRLAAGEQDTAWAACANPDEHPETGTSCRVPSFLDCFHCGNCVITRNDLPRLLSLLSALQQRRQQIGVEQWWRRYGATWVALRRDVLGGRHFTEAEIAHAQTTPVNDALLDLVENPWENTP